MSDEADRIQAEQARVARATKIADVQERGGKPQLCHCEVFTKSPRFISENGYCSFCGGFTPEVLRQHCGEDALFEAIDLLAHHDRVKMRELVGERRDIVWPEIVGE